MIKVLILFEVVRILSLLIVTVPKRSTNGEVMSHCKFADVLRFFLGPM